MKAGYCHYHKYTLTLRQMRKHGCLRKHGSWCKRFEPYLDHDWWKIRLEQGRSVNMAKPFIKKGAKDVVEESDQTDSVVL